ncbi:asparagine-rich antigen Pfa35-2 [Reticulomyxa filosa]|uniref:Asparagine-rich antigen Pfa35-2 n=1 Tax=Reticulomyxa filosa TaxID=46433 RepID=X6N545_RETFI|nr:asparagine-rich antigen Pfa35-2 [Reticulomyxa filosa]|eukprot:ETO21166.1 asparagine-rich antigen Pfa35-2 [Reticulomyxa filosa]
MSTWFDWTKLSCVIVFVKKKKKKRRRNGAISKEQQTPPKNIQIGIRKWRPLSEAKNDQDMELFPPQDRDKTLEKNLALRKEQAARINLNVPPFIQKCFNRLHRKVFFFCDVVTGKIEWRENAIVVNDSIIIDEKTEYQRAEIDESIGNNNDFESIGNTVAYINKVLTSFWRDNAEGVAVRHVDETEWSSNKPLVDTNNANQQYLQSFHLTANPSAFEYSNTMAIQENDDYEEMIPANSYNHNTHNYAHHRYHSHNHHHHNKERKKKKHSRAMPNQSNYDDTFYPSSISTDTLSVTTRGNITTDANEAGNAPSLDAHPSQYQHHHDKPFNKPTKVRDMNRSWRNSNNKIVTGSIASTPFENTFTNNSDNNNNDGNNNYDNDQVPTTVTYQIKSKTTPDITSSLFKTPQK